jgi:hypothetical protein
MTREKSSSLLICALWATIAGCAAPTFDNAYKQALVYGNMSREVEDSGAVTFLNAGTYDVTVSVSDGKGGTATSATRRITVSLGASPF